MALLEKVYNSRLTLREVLKDEWSTEVINDVSMEELEIMYNNQNDKSIMGSGCNFTLYNRKIPSHKLHVIYYNFPQLHLTGPKINKTCCDKLTAMYKQDGIEADDDENMFEKENINLKDVLILAPNINQYLSHIKTIFNRKNGFNDFKQAEIKEYTRWVDDIHIVEKDTLTIKYLHFNHTHFPITFDRNGKDQLINQSWIAKNQNYLGTYNQTYFALKQFITLINKLKEDNNNKIFNYLIHNFLWKKF